MNRTVLSLLILAPLALAACGQGTRTPAAQTPAAQTPAAQAPAAQTPAPTGSVEAQLAAYAARPELQDEDSQAILREYASDPLLLQSLQRAYGDSSAPLNVEALAAEKAGSAPLQSQASGRAGYAQSVAWGSVRHYRAEKASPNYSGLRWGSNGCSAPSGFGLGYRDDFRPACDVHDFGYGNLPWLISKIYWPYNKARTDLAFLDNMEAICAAKSLLSRPACYAAANAYYHAVDIGGWKSWISNG